MSASRDPLEQALAEPAYLEDGGFTDGVMSALPPRRASRRGTVLLVTGVAAAALGAATLGEGVVAAAAALGVTGAAGVMVVGAAVAAAAGALVREER